MPSIIKRETRKTLDVRTSDFPTGIRVTDLIDFITMVESAGFAPDALIECVTDSGVSNMFALRAKFVEVS